MKKRQREKKEGTCLRHSTCRAVRGIRWPKHSSNPSETIGQAKRNIEKHIGAQVTISLS